MIRTLAMQAKVLTGILLITGCALPQAYTISAKPGAISYVEGDVNLNGASVAASALRGLFFGKSDILATEAGKVEVLLTPGVFLRVGEHSQVRMIAPSLVDTQVEILAGQAMVEVDQVVPGSSTGVMDHGSSTVLTRAGLYRFTADLQPTAAVLEGKADVYFGAKKAEIGKNKQALLDDQLNITKSDLSKTDDLYAWSNVRAQYDSAVSYQGATSVYNSGGYGYGSGYQTSGLYWNNPYNSWMWLPGNGAFYSPFGWGFYGPGLVAYAPVVVYGYGGGSGYAAGAPYRPVTTTGKPMPVPINPKHPGVVLKLASSPATYAVARQQVQHSIGSTGYQFQTARGTPAAALAGGRTYSSPQAASRAAASSANNSVANSRSSGGGWAGGDRSSASSSRSSSPSPSISSGGGGSRSMSSGGSSAGGRSK